MLQRVKHANLKSWQNLDSLKISLKTVNMSGGNKWYNCTSQGNKNKVCSHSGKNEICLLLLLFKRKSAHEIQSVRASDNCTTSIRISFSNNYEMHVARDPRLSSEIEMGFINKLG